MMVKVVTLEEDGKVHLTKEELEEILDDAYRKGMKHNEYYYRGTVPANKWTVTSGLGEVGTALL